MELKPVETLSRNELILYAASVIDFLPNLFMFQTAGNQMAVFELTNDEERRRVEGHAMLIEANGKQYAAWNPMHVEEADNIFEHCAHMAIAPTSLTIVRIFPEVPTGRPIYHVELIDEVESTAFVAEHPDRGRAMIEALIRSTHGDCVPPLTFRETEPGTVYPATDVLEDLPHAFTH